MVHSYRHRTVQLLQMSHVYHIVLYFIKIIPRKVTYFLKLFHLTTFLNQELSDISVTEKLETCAGAELFN